MASVNDTQVGGSHYKSAYQHWDFVNDVLAGLYLEGCITKYIYRWRKKNGHQDVLKAQHYFLKLEESYRSQQICGGPVSVTGSLGYPGFSASTAELLARFITENNIEPLEARIVSCIAMWNSVADLAEIAALLHQLALQSAPEDVAPI